MYRKYFIMYLPCLGAIVRLMRCRKFDKNPTYLNLHEHNTKRGDENDRPENLQITIKISLVTNHGNCKR